MSRLIALAACAVALVTPVAAQSPAPPPAAVRGLAGDAGRRVAQLADSMLVKDSDVPAVILC